MLLINISLFSSSPFSNLFLIFFFINQKINYFGKPTKKLKNRKRNIKKILILNKFLSQSKK